MREPLDPAVARRVIRRVLRDGVVMFTRHAREEMLQDALDELDVRNTLRGGVVEPAERENDAWRYRCHALDACVVVQLDYEDDEQVELAEGVVVVTAWRDR